MDLMFEGKDRSVNWGFGGLQLSSTCGLGLHTGL